MVIQNAKMQKNKANISDIYHKSKRLYF
jgi:hypothetical protein